MSQHFALGLLIPFAARLGVKLISLWLDIRRAVAAALPDSSGEREASR
ncbi:hypothetical protein [Methylobacterium sp. D54C]